jgi:predicted signal transduction protein with EAL and GGDEF domain
MVNKILKVEYVGKLLLRIGIAIYMWSVVLLSFQLDKDKLWLAAVMAILVIIPGLSLLHYRNARTGLVGGIGTFLFFLGSAVILIVTDLAANLSWSMIYLHIIKDLLLMIGSVILIGESLKEMVREKITAPFPKK